MTTHRKRFFRTNKYQKKIVAVAFLPIVFVIVFMWIVTTVFYKEMVGVILYQSSADAIRLINQWGLVVFLGFMVVLFLVIFFSMSVSLNLVGAFERIIKELDDVVSGKSNKPLMARPKDELANELLKRINVLINRLNQKK